MNSKLTYGTGRRVVLSALFSLVPLIWLCQISFAQSPEIEKLIAGAKKEGEVVYYASMNLGEANKMIAGFEKQYPFLEVKLERQGSESLLSKVLAEQRAGKHLADVIQTVEFSMYTFKKNHMLDRYLFPDNGSFPQKFKDNGYWTTVYHNPYVAGYNTKLVTNANMPRTYEDLLEPTWKGKMLMEGTKVDWFAGMLQIMGKEKGLHYMRQLAKQNIASRTGHALLAQLIAAGEGWLDIDIPVTSVTRLKEKGAPIDWIALGKVPDIMVGIGLAKDAPHPNAAKLLLDFMLSLESQKKLQSLGRLVARSELAGEQAKTMRNIDYVPVDPKLADHIREYTDLMNRIFGG